ncbi:acyltransferase family protein [Leptospira kmetyi]|uniref:acyltransferase family protein n=1 Tax=Leptospira kmetyi TaxID=408139 RepID=UPI00108412BD|nr:acyltransferase family protein [Leptospira kmetyi]TGL65976.1 acyltransferase [Leptospira kmetyi]
MIQMSNRIHWVDTLKFLGIFAIYIGHFGVAAGKAYSFVFLYHVPLFFFVSGFFANSTSKTLFGYYRYKFFQLIVPYVFFSILALVYYSVLNDWEFPQVVGVGKTFLFGIRNQVHAASLWFIPCLFIISLLHYTLLKIFKNTFLLFVLAASLCAISQLFLSFNPLNQPSWAFNVDSAMYYYVYYVLGSILFPLLNKEISVQDKLYWIPFVIVSILSIFVSIVCYVIGVDWIYKKVSFIFDLYPLGFTFSIWIGMMIIYSNVLLAKMLSKVSFLGSLGKETLIFCGIENVFKSLFTQCFLLLGLGINLTNPMATILFSFLCLVVSYFTLIRFLNRYFPKFVGKLSESSK